MCDKRNKSLTQYLCSRLVRPALAPSQREVEPQEKSRQRRLAGGFPVKLLGLTFGLRPPRKEGVTVTAQEDNPNN